MKYPVDLKSPGAQIKSEKLKASLARHQEEMERLIKVRYWEKSTNIWKKSLTFFRRSLVISKKKVGEFFQILWPSHNIWNLKNISLRIKSQKPTDGPPPTPFKYSDELEDLEEPFDFTLQKHKGIKLKSIKI